MELDLYENFKKPPPPLSSADGRLYDTKNTYFRRAGQWITSFRVPTRFRAVLLLHPEFPLFLLALPAPFSFHFRRTRFVPSLSYIAFQTTSSISSFSSRRILCGWFRQLPEHYIFSRDGCVWTAFHSIQAHGIFFF